MALADCFLLKCDSRSWSSWPPTYIDYLPALEIPQCLTDWMDDDDSRVAEALKNTSVACFTVKKTTKISVITPYSVADFRTGTLTRL
jgi:hypothetical protein